MSGAKTRKGMDEALFRLMDVRDKLEEINRLTGAMERFDAMKEEILKIGWSGILARYHPDVNLRDPAAFQLFEMYTFAHEAIRQGR